MAVMKNIFFNVSLICFEMSEFKKLDIFQPSLPGTERTEDNLYWKNLGFSCAFQEYKAIDFIDFSPQEPYNVAVTCAAKVQIYSSANSALQRSLTRFKETAYGGRFRKDGKLLVAGSDDGWLRLFEVKEKRLLRIFKGHKAATHRCNFTSDGVHIVSFSDDKTVALWDIPTETKLKQFAEHKDYIRAGAISEASENLFLSGSYDQTVKLYDARTEKSVITVDHGAPVESVLMFPSGGLFISAGGTTLKVWDPVAGRLLAQVCQHHKTITSLCFASDERRLMSASLDRHVKIYDTTTYEVVHTLNYPSSILSVAVAPDDRAVGVGMTDGLFSLKLKKSDKPVKSEKPKKKSFYQSGVRDADFTPVNVDVVVPEQKGQVYAKYERHLKKFEISKALDRVLQGGIQNSKPEVTFSVLMELIRRGSVRAAMAGREGNNLQKLFQFVTRNIQDPRFMRILIDVGLILVELYGSKINDPETRKMFEVLSETVENQIDRMKRMMEIEGIIRTILVSTCPTDNEELVLSTGALENGVLS